MLGSPYHLNLLLIWSCLICPFKYFPFFFPQIKRLPHLSDNPAQSHWSSEGCTISKQYTANGSHFITCQCDHLTSFGVLLNIYEDSFVMTSSFELSLISQIGCYISIGSLLITIVSLSFLR